jgi:hypothetical protein
MGEAIKVTRAELVQIFQILDEHRDSGDWSWDAADPSECADKVIDLARDVC